MAAPSFAKTYGYRFDQRITASTVANENKDTWLAILAALKGTGLVNRDATPYTGAVFTCKGSSNGTAAGTNDSTDRIAARADIVHAASGTAHSWWRGQLGTSGLELLIDFNVVDANAASALVLISTVGFGAANGGVDGTTTARPTALDEVALSSSATAAVALLYTGASGDRLVNVQIASDGEVVRVFVRSASQYRVAIDICKAAAPVDGAWTKPWFGAARGVSNVYDANVASGNVWYGFKNGGGRFNGGLCIPSLAGSPITSTVAGTSSYNLAYDTYPIFFVGTEGGSLGYRGVMPDAWWIPNNLADGDTMPQLPAATRTHLVVGNFLIPNDGGTADLV